MKLYKLTDKNGQTHGGCQWGPGVQHETSGDGDIQKVAFGILCSLEVCQSPEYRRWAEDWLSGTDRSARAARAAWAAARAAARAAWAAWAAETRQQIKDLREILSSD